MFPNRYFCAQYFAPRYFAKETNFGADSSITADPGAAVLTGQAGRMDSGVFTPSAIRMV